MSVLNKILKYVINVDIKTTIEVKSVKDNHITLSIKNNEQTEEVKLSVGDSLNLVSELK